MQEIKEIKIWMYLQLIFPFVMLSFSFTLTEENTSDQGILDLEHLE